MTETQFALFHSTDEEEQETVIVDCARDLAHFIAWVVKHEKTPAPRELVPGKKTGGVGVWAWSAGCALLFGMLAYLQEFDEPTRAAIEANVVALYAFGKCSHFHLTYHDNL